MSAVTASFARLASMTLPATILPDTTALGASLSASTASLASSAVSTAPPAICAFPTVPVKSPPTAVPETLVESVVNDNVPAPLVVRYCPFVPSDAHEIDSDSLF